MSFKRHSPYNGPGISGRRRSASASDTPELFAYYHESIELRPSRSDCMPLLYGCSRLAKPFPRMTSEALSNCEPALR
jgi:hypothetical protein